MAGSTRVTPPCGPIPNCLSFSASGSASVPLTRRAEPYLKELIGFLHLCPTHSASRRLRNSPVGAEAVRDVVSGEPSPEGARFSDAKRESLRDPPSRGVPRDTTSRLDRFRIPRSMNSERSQERGSYLVDPASSHMLVSKIKPCMSKYMPY